MRPVSDAFLEAVVGPHRLATRATLLTGTDEIELDVLDGSVTRDSTAASRGIFDLSLPYDVDLVPTSSSSPLAPYGNEIKLERGVTFTDGTTEYVPFGYFRIEDVSVSEDAEAQPIRVSGVDRSAFIIDAVFEEPYSVASGTNVATAILAIVQDVYPDVDYDFATVSTTLPALLADTASDRWDFCQGLAEAAAMSLYFDRDGVLRLTPAPTGGDSFVYTVTEGDGGILLGAERNFQREGTFNRVIVTGENATATGDVPRGVATDDDPTSPTYYYGRFGRVPYFYSSEYVTDSDQAASVAEVILAKQKGIARSVSFQTIVNVALEPGDSIRILRTSSSFDEIHILDAVTYPLGPSEPMTASTRAVGGNNI